MTIAVRALVTNDDGIGSEGLYWLASAAIEAGLDVVVAAPLHDSSGTSASLTAIEAGGRIVVEDCALPGLDGVRSYGVAAAPGFIAMIATRGAFGAPPDVVLSGINRGANTGNAVLHSGTVGAAMTGRVHGCRALAVSIVDDDAVRHWSTAAVITRQALRWLLALDEPVVLNVNVPNVPFERVRGVRQGRLAAFGSVQTTIAESGRGWVRLGVADTNTQPDPDSDAALLDDGYASITPLRPLCAIHDVLLPPAGAPMSS